VKQHNKNELGMKTEDLAKTNTHACCVTVIKGELKSRVWGDVRAGVV